MVRMLHLADLHLGWTPDFLDEERRKIRQKERDSILERAVDFALKPEHDIHLVLIAGDLFEHHNPPPALIAYAQEQLGRLVKEGIETITIPGNHDEYSYHESVYPKHGRDWPGLLVQNPKPQKVFSKTIQGTPLHIYSLAYTGGVTPLDNLGPLPRTQEEGLHIGAFHGNLDADIMDRSLPLKSSVLAQANYHYIALGHRHAYEEHLIEETPAVYPGAIEHKTFSDPGTEHLLVVSFANEEPALETHSIDVRTHAKEIIDISGCEEYEEVLELCRRREDKEALMHLTLQGVPPFTINISRLQKDLLPYFYYVALKDETDFLQSRTVEQFTKEPTVRGQFTKKLLAKIQETQNEEDKEILELALLKGLSAFQGGDRQ